jgi:heavy metal sensor kinase
MLYFLVLLALVLGAVSVSAYRNTQHLLQTKEETRTELLKATYENNCKALKDQFDLALLAQATALAAHAKVEWNSIPWPSLEVLPVGALSAVANRTDLLHLPFWLSERTPNDCFAYLQRTSAAKIQFHEQDLPKFADNLVTAYFQINGQLYNPRGRGLPPIDVSWRPPSMGDDFSFPFEVSEFVNREPLIPKWDYVKLRPGVTVRLVTYKTFVAGNIYHPRNSPNRPPEKEKNGGRRSDAGNRPAMAPPPPPPPLERPAQAILIQCAAETTQRDAALAKLAEELQTDLVQLKTDSQALLTNFRNQLLWIGLATFGATVVGGFWLVRLGLSPLARLSDAVSKVSAKDFRLPFHEPRLPAELRPIVERLTETLELLKRAFAREKQAAADISHELRTPLAALLTTIEVGLRKPRSGEEYRELLADCHATGQQMSQLVERLLALARLDAGVDTLRPREVDVAALADQCATLVRPLAEARGLSLRVQRNGPLPLKTDPDKLREILTNLLHNAIEYNRPNGSVELAVEQQNGRLQVEVRDTGIGIAPEARAHIFERFYRADASRQAEGLHAGLGLSIVKGYVDLMGGTICVDSQEGQGSAFRLHLPV